MANKNAYSKERIIWRMGFGGLLILVGLLLNYFGLGKSEFFSYSSVGGYLIFCGILILAIAFMFSFSKKKKIIDERMEKIGHMASRITFSVTFILAFILMIIDGISPIIVSLSDFLAYSICVMLIIYFVSYKILERRY